MLFRCYPGPWQVLRRRRGGGPSGEDRLEVVHTQADYPGVQRVALEVLPRCP